MSTAEKLARQVRRVADLRGRVFAEIDHPFNDRVLPVDQLLERACQAIGSGDEGRMHAVGLELEAVQ